LEFVDSSTAGKTYTLEGVDSGDNVKLRLSDGTTDDDVTITAGSNITIDSVAAGGFTIAAVAGAGLAPNSTISDLININGGVISADDAGGDKIFFWDDSAGKATHLTTGTGLTINGTTITANSDAGKTYTLTAVDSGNNVKLRLGDGTTNDDVLITAGSNITINPVAAGGFTIAAVGSGGGSGILSDITVDYTGRSSPCTLPITVTEPSAGTKQINIPDNSNAFGAKYVQTSEPTGSSVCNGDIWYDTSAGGGSVNSVLTGTIHMWGGSVASIPSGYQLCNGGSASTSELQAITGANVPDLRDRFIVGAGSGYAVGATGGSANATLVSHNHGSGTLSGSTNQRGGQSQFNPSSPSLNVSNLSGDSILSSINSNKGEETDFNNGDILQIDTRHTHTVTVTGSTSTEGSSATNANLPPYYALVYMIKT
jgi:hypothetical protein